MNKPEKEVVEGLMEYDLVRALVYNEAHKDWEAFLPNEKEVLKIIIDVAGTFTGYLSLAKVISKRIGK